MTLVRNEFRPFVACVYTIKHAARTHALVSVCACMHLDLREFACVHTHKCKHSFLHAFACVCMCSCAGLIKTQNVHKKSQNSSALWVQKLSECTCTTVNLVIYAGKILMLIHHFDLSLILFMRNNIYAKFSGQPINFLSTYSFSIFLLQ